MNIPAIGAARGIFEMFVPGAFLVLNIVVVVYTTVSTQVQAQIRDLASNTILSLVVLICFGYLAGVIMRLFRTNLPDQWSGELHQLFQDSPEPWTIEEFPYINWIGQTWTIPFGPSGTEGADALKRFHQQVWAVPRAPRGNTIFFNFCKTLINSVDERAASEINAAEALSRYVTGMFYALLVTLFLMLVGLIAQLIQKHSALIWVFALVLLVYLLMFLSILWYYRTIRIKEVGTVFCATYHHRELFGFSKPRAPHTWRERLRQAIIILTGRAGKP